MSENHLESSRIDEGRVWTLLTRPHYGVGVDLGQGYILKSNFKNLLIKHRPCAQYCAKL